MQWWWDLLANIWNGDSSVIFYGDILSLFIILNNEMSTTQNYSVISRQLFSPTTERSFRIFLAGFYFPVQNCEVEHKFRSLLYHYFHSRTPLLFSHSCFQSRRHLESGKCCENISLRIKLQSRPSPVGSQLDGCLWKSSKIPTGSIIFSKILLFLPYFLTDWTGKFYQNFAQKLLNREVLIMVGKRINEKTYVFINFNIFN